MVITGGAAIESVIGVDLGGSTIRLGAVTKDGKLGHFTKIEVPAGRNKEAIVSFIVNSIQDILLAEEQGGNKVLAAGIGSPGIIKLEKGVIVTSPNFPGWKNVPMKSLIEKSINIPVFINNDANSAAYGEKWMGAGKRVSSMICLTLGTGIGGGIVLDNKVWHGAQGMGGELGHITVNPEGPLCNCGNYGCLESYSSATGMVRRTAELIKSGKRTKLIKLSRLNNETSKIKMLTKDSKNPPFTKGGHGGVFSGGNITAKMIYEAAVEGDRVSINILREAGKYLGIAIAGFINILNPEMVVLTGEVTGAWNFFFPALREEVEKRAYTAIIRHTKIVRGKLKGTAGTIGAAGLAWNQLT